MSRVTSAALCLGALVLLAGCGTTATGARGPRPEVVPTSSVIAGRSYPEWEAAWSRWRLALASASAAPRGRCIAADQHGPVWFLSVDEIPVGNTYVVRHETMACTIPPGDYVMMTSPWIDCSTVERPPFYASTGQGLQACASRIWQVERPTSHLSVDGVPVTVPAVPVTTAPFAFSLPARDKVLPTRLRGGRAAVVGLAAILRPLAPGLYTFVKRSSFRGPGPTVVAYRIRVL